MPYFTIGEDVCAYRRFCNLYRTLHICFLVFFCTQKSGRESMVICRRLIFPNSRHHLPQNPELYQSPSIYYSPFTMQQNMRTITHSRFYRLYFCFKFRSVGVHFLPARHGLVKERQAVTFRLRCQRSGAQGYQISSLITLKMVPRYMYLDLSR